MHVLYIHQYFATPKGSTGTRSYEFARRWIAAGHRVTVVTSPAQLTASDFGGVSPSLITRLSIDGINVIVLNVQYHQTMGFWRRMMAFVGFMILSTVMVLRMKNVDVVYATSTPLTVGIPALLAWWLRRWPYVFEVRDAWPAVPIAMGYIRNRLLIRFLRSVERTIYRGARAVVSLSAGMAASVRQQAPNGLPITTVPNSADTDLFRPDIDPGAIRSERHWEGRFVCIYTGAMGPANGLDTLVRAACHFQNDPAFLFVLFGQGREKSRIVAAADELGLENMQIADSLPKHALPAVIAASDVCLVTFANVKILQDNSANKFFDYLSAGKPVVLNYGGWQREVLESAQAGLGCALGDERAFFENLALLKTDAKRRTSMGRNARRLALQRYNRDLLAAQALEVIVETRRRYPKSPRSHRI